MRKYALAPVAAAILLAAAGAAQAASATTTFRVTADVAGNCRVSASDLVFGSYIAGTPLAGQSAVKVRCTTGTAYAVKLSAGTSLSLAQRTMKNGTNSLNYNLFADSGHTSIWGDGATASTVNRTGTGTGLSALAEATFDVYGLVPDTAANQDAAPGSYLDTITVSVDY
jgi:spore coat protein U-like protein